MKKIILILIISVLFAISYVQAAADAVVQESGQSDTSGEKVASTKGAKTKKKGKGKKDKADGKKTGKKNKKDKKGAKEPKIKKVVERKKKGIKAEKGTEKPKDWKKPKTKKKNTKKKNEPEELRLIEFVQVTKRERFPGQFGVYKGKPQELYLMYSNVLGEQISMNIEESLALDPIMQKPHFDKIINETMRKGLDEEVEKWSENNPLWKTPLAWFIKKADVQEKYNARVKQHQDHYWDWWVSNQPTLKQQVYSHVGANLAKSKWCHKDYISYSFGWWMSYTTFETMREAYQGIVIDKLQPVVLEHGKKELLGMVKVWEESFKLF